MFIFQVAKDDADKIQGPEVEKYGIKEEIDGRVRHPKFHVKDVAPETVEGAVGFLKENFGVIPLAVWLASRIDIPGAHLKKITLGKKQRERFAESPQMGFDELFQNFPSGGEKNPDENFFEKMARKTSEKGGASERKPGNELVTMPHWPEKFRGTPNINIRSSLFGMVPRSGPRPTFKTFTRIPSQANTEVWIRGDRFGQDELDILNYFYHKARGADFRDKDQTFVYFTLSELAKECGRSTGGKILAQLRDSIERMEGSDLKIVTPTYEYHGSLIAGFVREKNTDKYVVGLNPFTPRLFVENYTWLEYEVRKKLRGEYQKYMHNYVSSHRATPDSPHEVELSNVRTLMGPAETLEARDFKKAIKTAMVALEKLGVVAWWDIREGRREEKLVFVRPQRSLAK